MSASLFYPSQLLTWYQPMNGILFSCMVGFPPHLFIKLGGIKSFRLINSSLLTDCHEPPFHHHNVTALAVSFRYFRANCSSDLANCMPPLLPQPRCTRLASSSHPYSVYLSNARVNQYFQSFIPFSGKLWNSLPASVFPPAYDLNCSREKYQDTYPILLAHESGLSRDRH